MFVRETRSNTATELTWDLTALFPTESAWQAAMERCRELLLNLQQFRGRLAVPYELVRCLEKRNELESLGDQVYWFAYNRTLEDRTNVSNQAMMDRANTLIAEMHVGTEFVTSEILGLPDETIEQMQSLPEIQEYSQWLQDLRSQRERRLSPEGESIVAHLSEAIDAPFAIWQAATNADIRFEPVTNGTGTSVSMSVAMLGKLLTDRNRNVRQAAFDSAAKAYDALKHTLTASLATAVRSDVSLARIHGFSSTLEAVLEPLRLPSTMYQLVLGMTERGSEHFRAYLRYRKKQMGLSVLAPYDLSVPLVNEASVSYSPREAVAIVNEALSPLGADYRRILQRAFQERWVDWADNEGKAAGPSTMGCYGFRPSVSLPWHGTLSDLYTLVHELGHAVHFTMAADAQPYHYAAPSTLLAEVAATTNELLLTRHLLERAKEPEVYQTVLHRAIGVWSTNFFLGGMMSHFQAEIHRKAEEGEPLTYETFTLLYTNVLQRYYGDTVVITPEEMGSVWMRAPHHYQNYYAYQYVVGISCAAVFAESVWTGDQRKVTRYLGLLKAGSAGYPVDLLRSAGVDISTPEPFEHAINTFAGLVSHLEATAI